VRDWAAENVGIRKYASAIAVRNLDNDVPDEAVDTLLETCRKNAPLFQRYFRFKAKRLGVDTLRRFDLYAPLAESDKSYTFDEGTGMVLESLGAFAPVLADHARRVFDEGHLDSEVRPRKDTGAFCAGATPDLTPWVLMNFNGKPDDVATLAHEIGHAVHSMMASDHSVLTFHAPLPLAETASVFSEMLLLERLLGEEKDPAVRRDLLGRFIDDAYATVMRQAYFVLFERDAHRMVEEGVTIDGLSAAYLENLKQQFGDSVEVNEEFALEWVCIPHIYHTPFYCYAYSFGQLLVLALYRKYKEEGAAFVPRYLEILSSGGSMQPADVIARAGFDMASEAFWQGGFDVLAGMMDELEGLEG
jgi:oligoendopeptidase F